MLKTPLNLAMLGDPEAQQFCEMLSLAETFAPLTDGGCGPTGAVLAVDSIRITFPSCVDIVATTGIEVNIGGAGWEAVASVSGGSDRVWEFATTTEIAEGDVVLWQYLGAEDSIVDCTESVDVGAIDPVTVRNPLELTAPTLVSAEVGTVDDSTFVYEFSEDIDSADFAVGWSIAADATPLTITGATEVSPGTLHVAVAEDVYVDQVITTSYDAGTGDIADVTGYPTPNVLASITDAAVTNNSTTEVETGPIWERDFTGNSLGADSTFTRDSTGYHKNPDSLWAAISSNLPRFTGATWNGSAWSGTATGLLMEPSATNVAWPSNDLTHANWVSPYGTQAFDQVGLTGAANTATQINDNNAAQYANWDFITAVTPGTLYSTVFYITKRASTASYPGVRMGFASTAVSPGPSDPRTTWMINTNTGAAVEVTNSSGIADVSCNVFDDGARWKVVLSSRDGGSTKGYCACGSYAAVGTTWGVLSNAAQGIITVENAGLYNNIGHALAQLMTPIVTTTAATARAVDALSYSGVPADNETRIITTAGNVDIDDWNGALPTPTAPYIVSKIEVYNPGERPA